MIYLDSAATTLEKPTSVPGAVAHAIRHYASPGRGGYQPSMDAAELMLDCRELACSMFDVPDPEQVVFTFNATHGLNIAIRSLVKPGSTVLISGYEHNAVTRALYAIPDIQIKAAAGELFDGEDVFRAFDREMTPDVDVVICNHVSNVFGFIQPVDQIARLCLVRGKPLIVDASQSAGTLPVSLDGWGAAFIAMPGHKGLYGPQGTGLLLCREIPEPLLFGGTGSASLQQEMPDFLPDRLEAGTQNVCGVAGLYEGMKFVNCRSPRQILAHEQRLCDRMTGRLQEIPGVELFSGANQSGVLSFNIQGLDCEEVAETLAEHGVAVRAGLHCAPLAHQSAGTLRTGTVRASFSAFNTEAQIDCAARKIRAVAEGSIRS